MESYSLLKYPSNAKEKTLTFLEDRTFIFPAFHACSMPILLNKHISHTQSNNNNNNKKNPQARVSVVSNHSIFLTSLSTSFATPAPVEDLQKQPRMQNMWQESARVGAAMYRALPGLPSSLVAHKQTPKALSIPCHPLKPQSFKGALWSGT